MIKKLTLITAFVAGFTTLFAQDAGLAVMVGVNQSWWYGRDLETLADQSTGMTLGKDLPNLEYGEYALHDDYGNKVYRYTDKTHTDSVLLDSYIMGLGNLQKKMGYSIGFEVNSELSNHFWLKHQFFFNTKGFSYQGTRFDTTANSIESGINMRLRTYNVDIMPFGIDFQYEGMQVFAGPYISVLLGSYWVEVDAAKNKSVTQTGVYDFHYYDIATDKLEAREIGIMDYGMAVGTEYKFPFGMNLGFSYKYGIGRMYEARPRHTKTAAFSKSMNVYIGYTFGEQVSYY